MNVNIEYINHYFGSYLNNILVNASSWHGKDVRWVVIMLCTPTVKSKKPFVHEMGNKGFRKVAVTHLHLTT